MEALAHVALALAAGLSLHPAWRQPQGHLRLVLHHHHCCIHRRVPFRQLVGGLGRGRGRAHRGVIGHLQARQPQSHHHRNQSDGHHAVRRIVARSFVEFHDLGRLEWHRHVVLPLLERLERLCAHLVPAHNHYFAQSVVRLCAPAHI